MRRILSKDSPPSGLFRANHNIEIVLASSSPRRAELISTLGFKFIAIAPGESEPIPAGEDPRFFARKAAIAKGMALPLEKNSLIIAADTVVGLNGEIFGKPRSATEALYMLKRLTGHTHVVTTVFFLRWADRQYCEAVDSYVRLGKWPDNVLERYVQSGEPMDKAGAYAIQGLGAFLVEDLQGSWTNVVGLPLAQLARSLLENDLITPV